MNILLVDDDYSMIEMLETSIDWKSLGLDIVYKAYNANQAKAIFNKHSIDIMLCDIEMPNCNGITLLEWVRAHKFKSQVIFLTNYAEFHFAQEALRLGSFDFITKTTTIEAITTIIRRATVIVKSLVVKDMYHSLGQHWENSKHYLYNQFYEQIYYGNIIGNDASIKVAAASRNLTIDLSINYYLILISADSNLVNSINWSVSELSFTIKNIMSEFFFDSVNSPFILNVSNNNEIEYVLLFPNSQFIHSNNTLETHFKQLSLIYTNILKTSMYFYYSDKIGLSDIHQTAKLLYEIKLNNVMNKKIQSIHDFQTATVAKSSIQLFDFSLFFDDMLIGNTVIILNKFKLYLSGIDKSQLDISSIQSMVNHYNQLYFSVLKQKHYNINDIISSESEHLLQKNSSKSLYDFMKWMNISMKKLEEHVAQSKKHIGVIDEVIDYIHIHLQDNLNKTILANMVHLNSDYLAKIFKKETGESLSNYINKIRLEKSKELLANPDLSLNYIANKTGFDNYSYYSSLFKKTTGMSPKLFRDRL